jgi:hypothetical protein
MTGIKAGARPQRLFWVAKPSRPGPWDNRLHLGWSRITDDSAGGRVTAGWVVGFRFGFFGFKRYVVFEPLLELVAARVQTHSLVTRVSILEALTQKLSPSVEHKITVDVLARRSVTIDRKCEECGEPATGIFRMKQSEPYRYTPCEHAASDLTVSLWMGDHARTEPPKSPPC